jgi:hypothetical protein
MKKQGDVVDLMFNNEGDGLAFVLKCYDNGTIPTTIERAIANQGCKNKGKGVVIAEPYHIVN